MELRRESVPSCPACAARCPLSGVKADVAQGLEVDVLFWRFLGS